MYISTGSGRSQKKIDLLLLTVVIILSVFGIIAVYSSSYYSLEFYGLSRMQKVFDHIIRLLLGLILMFIFMVIPSRYYKKYAPYVFSASIFFLLLLIPFGKKVMGAKRWLPLGSINFQPSEFAKFALIFFLASLIARNKRRIKKLKFFFILTAPIAIVFLLTLIQPSVSMATLILITSFSLIFVAGARISHMLLPVLLSAVIGFGVYSASPETFSHVKDRIRSFKKGDSYQSLQAKIAIAEGKLLGEGLGKSKQKYFYLPQAQEDFIYSIFCEETGFAGGATVIFLFLIFIIRGFKIAETLIKHKLFEGLLAFGITFMIGIYALAHIAVNLGLGPTTGLPLPFISFGGTSLLINLSATGVLLGLSSQAGELAE